MRGIDGEQELASDKQFPRLLCGSDGKESACKAGDLGLIPGSGRPPGEGKSYPLYYSCLDTVRLTHTHTHTHTHTQTTSSPLSAYFGASSND